MKPTISLFAALLSLCLILLQETNAPVEAYIVLGSACYMFLLFLWLDSHVPKFGEARA
jgi:hypothetical protein